MSFYWRFWVWVFLNDPEVCDFNDAYLYEDARCWKRASHAL